MTSNLKKIAGLILFLMVLFYGGRAIASSGFAITVTVINQGLTFELYDESGRLTWKRGPLVPPAEAVMTTRDGHTVKIYVPKTILAGPTTVRVYIKGTGAKREIISLADKRGRAGGIISIPEMEALEFTVDADIPVRKTLTFSYPPSLEVAMVNSLGIYRLDEANIKWDRLAGSRIDPAVYTISIDLDTFSIYKVMAQAASDLDDVIVYPNPFIPSQAFGGCLKFINLTSEVTIRIYNIAGDLVWKKEIEDSGGGALWYGVNDRGEPVASGVYIYIITNPDGEKVTGKISVLR